MDKNKNKQITVSVSSAFFNVSAAPNMCSTVTGGWTTPCDVFTKAEQTSLSLPLNISCICPSLQRSLRVLEGGHR